MKQEKGIRRTIWLPKDFDEEAEQTRKHLGMGISAFYRFCAGIVVKDFIKEKEAFE
ncbi:MAG: hypothetical protein ABSC91_11140 [Candidatus Bathyarchaeia archaeon]|jgi:hypothetical protein